MAQALDHVCVTPGNLTFSCPAYNTVEREPIFESGNVTLKCRVCGMLETNLTDVDPRDGVFKSILYFGPNALEGFVDENIVLGYYIFFADNCSRKIGQAVDYVEKSDVAYPSSCCQYDAYAVEIDVELPQNFTNVTLMVVPNTAAGELSVGMTTDPLVDFYENITEVEVVRAVTGGAGRTSLDALLALLALFWWAPFWMAAQ